MPGRIERPRFSFTKGSSEAAGSNDAIMAAELKVSLPPGGGRSIQFLLGVTKNLRSLGVLERRLLSPTGVAKLRKRVGDYWQGLFHGFEVHTPDSAMNLLLNRWLKYQVFSSRIFGRSGYYAQGGVMGYREIQDLLVVIPLEPKLARRRLLVYAENQYSDLSIPHHFDPLTGEKGKAAWSDDMLWLPFITVHYLKETNDFSLLKEKTPYIDGPGKESYYLHCVRGIQRVLATLGRSGLPLILEGDWNDGLSAVGIKGKGESVWLGHFLAGILRDFIPISERMRDLKRARAFRLALDRLKGRLNTVGWDGEWYKRARCDDGSWIGSRKNREGKVYLNAQVWAILHDVVPNETRLAKILKTLDSLLYSQEGPLLLWPAYSKPDARIGYLSRYNPGVRENGGVYTHAANWALQAEAKLGRREKVWAIYEKLCPIFRSEQDPDRYQAEPYVTSGSIEYHPSSSVGKGGWSWYTSGAAWFYKVLTEWVLGIRPRYDGLEVSPVVPSSWRGFTVKRTFRGRELDISVTLSDGPGKWISVDGKPIEEDFIPAAKLRRRHHRIEVVVPSA